MCSQGGRCVDPTGTVSSSSAIQADLDELAPAVGLGVPYALPPNIQVLLDDPDGDGIALTIGDTSSANHAVIFDGNGSMIRVDEDVIGLRLRSSASYSTIRDVRIDPPNDHSNTTHDGIGIDVRAHAVRINNVFVRRMGTGIRATTYIDNDGDGIRTDDYANVNSQQWSKLRFDDCYVYAIELEGGDASAGTFSGVEVVTGNGIRDDSFLGNLWLGVVTEGTVTTSIDASGGGQASTWVGTYIENSDPDPTSSSLNNLWVGGNGVGRVSGVSERVGYRNASLMFQAANGLRMNIPGSSHSPFRWKHPDENEEWMLKYEDTASTWAWVYNGSHLQGWTLGWTGDQHVNGPGLYDLNIGNESSCTNGLDDDGDGDVDCGDPDCDGDLSC